MKKTAAVIIALALLFQYAFAVISLENEIIGEDAVLIVELEGNSVLEQINNVTSAKSAVSENAIRFNVMSEQAKIKENIEDSISEKTDILYRYTEVFNGFAIRASSADMEKIKNLPGVKNVTLSNSKYKDFENSAPETSEKETESCCEMINADFAHDNGIRGSGTVIAIIDSGFDVSHENFKGSIENPRYTKSDIEAIIPNLSVKNNITYVNQVYRNEKIPFAFNYSSKNEAAAGTSATHGTHVAGIAAGNNGKLPDGRLFESVAPDAQLVLMATPGYPDAAILAALDDVAKFDADALNCSWGAAYVNANLDMQRAFDNLALAGVAVSVANGNEDRGYYDDAIKVEDADYTSIGNPASISSVTSVASSNNIYEWTTAFVMRVGNESLPYVDGTPNYPFRSAFSEESEYVYVGTSESFENFELTGKIAIADATDMKTSQKFPLLKAAGAVGAVIIWTKDSLAVSVTEIANFPAAIVKYSDGEILKNAAEKKLTATAAKISTHTLARIDGVSEYSTWGVPESLEIKPEITAPGGLIYSSFPDDKYGVYNGTSMASPHMAGAYALMSEYLSENSESYNISSGDTRKKEIREMAEKLIMSSADIYMQDVENNIPFSPRAQGAGEVNLQSAITTPVVLSVNGGKPKLSLKDKLSQTFEVSFEATNFSAEAVEYNINVITEADDYYEENGENYVGNSKLLSSSQSAESVTIAPNSTQTVSFNITLSELELAEQSAIFTNGFFVDGFIRLEPESEDVPSIGLPFIGFYGDWSAMPVLDKPYYDEDTVLGQTYIGSGTSCKLVKLANGAPADGCTPLGKNLFAPNSDYDGEKYAGVSPNNDGMYDYICIAYTGLRNAAETNIEIKLGDDIVALGSVAPALKFTPMCVHLNQSTLASLPEGSYKVTMSAALDYEGAEEESIEMNFCIDKTAPVIQNANVLEEDGKTYLELSASDNNYVMGYVISDNSTGEEIKIAANPESPYVKCDISGIDPDDISIKVYDYAYNNNESDFKNIRIAGAAMQVSGDTATVEFEFANDGASALTGDVMLAVYDENNIMQNIYTQQNVTFETGSKNIRFEIDFVSDRFYGLFLWQGLENMDPLMREGRFIYTED